MFIDRSLSWCSVKYFHMKLFNQGFNRTPEQVEEPMRKLSKFCNRCLSENGLDNFPVGFSCLLNLIWIWPGIHASHCHISYLSQPRHFTVFTMSGPTSLSMTTGYIFAIALCITICSRWAVVVQGFNVDTSFPLYFTHDDTDSQFGLSLALHSEGRENMWVIKVFNFIYYLILFILVHVWGNMISNQK